MEVGQELVARSPSGRRRYSRRSASRTTEILEAAAAEFLERGFNEAKLEAVAQRAGIARSLIYRYFATKEDVFRAVVIDTLAPHVQSLKDRTETAPGGLAPLLRGLAEPMARVAATTPLAAVFKLVVSESRAFPELAQICHDQVLQPALASLEHAVADAQARGEVRSGDPRLFALQILSPLLTALTFSDTFVPVGAAEHDLEALLRQCVEVFLEGALTLQAPA